MPSFADHRLVPGSERAVEIVGDKLMAEIVRDLRKPPELPAVSPEPHAVGSGFRNPAPLTTPSGTRYVDAICESFAERDPMAKIAENNTMVTSVTSVLSSLERDTQIKELEAKIALLEKRLALQENRDEAKTKKTETAASK
jgi:hypothetical protein